jgi:cytolysin-activating lysine-acyltransferase
MNADQLASAKRELEKLPLLGPALWLFARDPMRRFTFVADIDWRLLPPLVLDQCKLYSREGLPWAFVTWARVGDAVDQRLRSSAPLIAPHEWKSGDKLWLIDVVAPFGDAPGIARQALKEIAGASTANAWLPGAEGGSVLHVVRRDG